MEINNKINIKKLTKSHIRCYNEHGTHGVMEIVIV